MIVYGKAWRDMVEMRLVGFSIFVAGLIVFKSVYIGIPVLLINAAGFVYLHFFAGRKEEASEPDGDDQTACDQ